MSWIVKPLLILAAVVAALVVFQVIDRAALTRRQGRIHILQKFYRELNMSTTYSRIGNAMRPVTTEQPEAWVLKVEMGGRRLEVNVSREVFEGVDIGDELSVLYTQCRLRRSIEILSVDSLSS